MRLDLLAALSTLVPIISSSMRVISSRFFPALLPGGGRKGLGLVGDVGTLTGEAGALTGEVCALATRLTLLLSLRL